jgi:hypothetical protein
MNEAFFRFGWGLICHLNSVEPHPLKYGSGRSTLTWWANNVNGERFSPSFYRSILNEAVSRGLAINSTSHSNHNIYLIED